MAFDPNNPPEPVIETLDDDDSTSPEWTPTIGLIRGCTACAIAAALLGIGSYALASRRPDIMVAYLHEDTQVTLILGVMGAMFGFLCTWILFAVMHRVSQIVGNATAALVVAFALLLIVSKQVAVAQSGFELPDSSTGGWEWFSPKLFITSNTGTWCGLVVAVWMFREGDSITEVFS